MSDLRLGPDADTLSARRYRDPMLFDIGTRTVGDWDVLSVVGDLDLAGLPALRQGLDRLDGSSVAIDLGGVVHLDPVVLGVFHVGALRATRSGGRFRLVCPPGPVRDLLAETRVDTLLEVVDELDSLG